MKKNMKKVIGLVLILATLLAMTGCGASNAQSEEKVVNIGITDSLGGINPLLTGNTWVDNYAISMEFLPLMDLGGDLEFKPMLADSITTEDNQNFIIHVDDDATWSDDTPITAEDVEFTFLRLASPVIANPNLMLYAFEGVGDDGFVEEGADHIEGITVLDEKSLQITTKYPMALTTFENTYAFYVHILPKHVLEQYSEAELSTLEWFNSPDVVSGPYILTEYDVNHYISYTANENYWKGAPKIGKLNFRILDSSQIYASLQSGEIDMTHHTMTAIPQEDYENIEALDNVEVIYGSPVTNQSIFIQTANIPDKRVRQALLYAIDRNQLVEQLMKGHGEVIEGFLSSAGPFYDEAITPISYDPDKAKELLAEAGWDGSQTLRFYVNSGDGTFVNAAQVMASQWEAVGIKVEIQTVDLATLMTIAGSTDYDFFAVQYTYTPVDPYPDVEWLLGGEGSWTGYSDDEVNVALQAIQTASSIDEIKGYYSIIDKKMQEDVPMFSAYVISAQGAVNKRMTGVNIDVYGTFTNVEEWDIVK